jgi:hypothetical protein
MAQHTYLQEEIIRMPNKVEMRNMDKPRTSVEVVSATNRGVYEDRLNASTSPYRAAYLKSHHHQ